SCRERQHARAQQRRAREDPHFQRRATQLQQVHRQQHAHVAIAYRPHPLGREDTAHLRPVHLAAPNVKSSKSVTLSALVQTPTAPAPEMCLSSTSMRATPSRITRMRVPANSTRSVCHVLPATGASTYLIVLRLPRSV